ncbi:MAG: molecular chaperone DnaJ [Reyranella sp.]|uniref:J domain-containing protein n=1 Tax=Reyranella sp. TaxID=1929291 RepID=UPI001228F87C|nr:J domain-containing protein [Reyranella sp.]TAJ91136.1 MAG: molecular chaperone DnaJ [Reyranella sp.]TBR28099.1 MAG: molecular chaperone DnaJ [Reyranella sp.]
MARRRANPLAALDGAKPHQRVCEAPGCRLQGEYRAPRARDKLDEYRWFCLDHVRDYNKKWDYFAGLEPDQIEAHIRADTTWRRPVWPLGARRNGNSYAHIKDPFGLADDAGLGEKPPPKYDGSEQLTPAERNALDVLELSWPLTRKVVKSRYKELVKLHHPDANGGAREAEEKLKEINAAYSTLRASEHLPAE